MLIKKKSKGSLDGSRASDSSFSGVLVPVSGCDFDARRSNSDGGSDDMDV